MMIKRTMHSILPSPLLFLCLVLLLQSLSASLSSENTFLVRAQADDDTLIDPVNDTFDYENPDKDLPPEAPNKDLDKLRPDESGKPGANGGKNDGGKNGGNKNKGDNDNNDQNDKNNGMKTKLNDKNNVATGKNDVKNDKTNNNAYDADADLVDTAGGADQVPTDPQGVTIVGGVAVVPAAENASIVATVPEILPPMPVDTGLENAPTVELPTLPTSAMSPIADISSAIEPIMAESPAVTAGGVSLVHVAPWVVGMTLVFV